MPALRDFYEMLEQSQWWTPDRLAAWQRHQLQALLVHARATTPYYRFRLNKVLRPDGTVDWDNWHRIPIVRRSDVVEQFKSMLSMAPVQQHGALQDYQSSGSTGDPVTVRTTRWLMQTSQACTWRAHRWGNLDWSKTLVFTAAEDKSLTAGDDLGPWGPPWLPDAKRGRYIYSYYRTPFPDRFRIMLERGASYHATTAPAAGRLVEEARATNVQLHLDALLVRGGAVTDLLRKDLRETFGADVVEFYSSKECGAIAQRCPQGHGYHVNAETVFLEVVDAEGMPVAPGQAGRAVITPFASTALPLIRYDQGDIVVAGAECSCGRGLPVIESISGREANFFTHPDGRKLDRGLTQECRELIGAGQVQIAQVGPTDYEVRYTPRDWGVPRDEEKFARKFREIIFEDSSVTLVEMKEIPLSPAGKFLASVVEWRKEGSAGPNPPG